MDFAVPTDYREELKKKQKKVQYVDDGDTNFSLNMLNGLKIRKEKLNCRKSEEERNPFWL